MIKISDLYKSYGKTKVLKGVSLEINEGDIYGIVGSSGAGKSTLLRCINGLEDYESGNLTVNGIEIKGLNDNELRELRKNIGMIFQQFAIITRKTVYENVALPMRCWGYDKTKTEERVKTLLEIVGIANKAKERPKNLSGGQLQRVAIARALSLDSKILLCDEATSALDPQTTDSILDLLVEINQNFGITIVIVTHQMEVIRKVCNRMSIIDKGSIVASGTVSDIFVKKPKLLSSLMIQNLTDILPDEGINVRIIYSNTEEISQNVLSNLARDLDLDYSLVWSDIDKFREGALGSVILNFDLNRKDEVFEYLNMNGYLWEEVTK